VRHKRFFSKNFRVKALETDDQGNITARSKRGRIRNATLEPYKPRENKNIVVHEANNIIKYTKTGTYSPDRKMNQYVYQPKPDELPDEIIQFSAGNKYHESTNPKVGKFLN
jgi:hypothetical protein